MKKTEMNIVPSTQLGTSFTRMDNSQIPVLVTSRLLEDSKGTSVRQEKPSENTVHHETSVAARKAHFQKLDSSVPKLRNKNKLPFSKEKQKPEVNKGVIKWPVTDVKTHITNVKIPNVWTPRKKDIDPPELLNNAKKLDLENNELEEIHNLSTHESANRMESLKTVYIEEREFQRKCEKLQKEKKELEQKLQMEEWRVHKFETVSKQMCKEYEQLKRQYDVEIGAMHEAMQQASEWYKQNRKLKRMSQLMMQHCMENNSMPFMMLDEVDSNSEDLDQLRGSVTRLSSEIAGLQTELHSARLLEFEAQEQVMNLTMQLEEERNLRRKVEKKANELTVYKENMERITKMVAKEVQDMTVQCNQERENAQIYKTEAEKIQKERDILAHQSTILMADVEDDSSKKLLNVLQKMEELKKEQIKDNDMHVVEKIMLEKKLHDAELERTLSEEKVNIAEAELEMVIKRADSAEKSAEKLENIVHCLKEEISKLKEKSSSASLPPLPPPMPPPPPPPPPPMPSMSMAKESTIKLLTKEKPDAEHTAISKMEKMLGMSPNKKAAPQKFAIDDIISQIKGGHFTLKQTKQREAEQKKRQGEEDAPAVSEMLNILGIMRRRAKPTRQPVQRPDMTRLYS